MRFVISQKVMFVILCFFLLQTATISEKKQLNYYKNFAKSDMIYVFFLEFFYFLSSFCSNICHKTLNGMVIKRFSNTPNFTEKPIEKAIYVFC